MSGIITGFQNILAFDNLLLMNLGVFIGIVFGAIPGLTGNLAIILFLPSTFALTPIGGISMLLGIYCGGAYGGSVSAILLGTPGSNAAVATIFDGYPMALNGQARKAMSMALVASTIGGLISAVSLLVAAPVIAKFAIEFGPEEYFALSLFGLSIIAGVSGKNLWKGLISGSLGVVISTIGLDSITAANRFTFGNIYLLSGFNVLGVLLGVFALNTIMYKVLNKEHLEGIGKSVTVVGTEDLTFQEFKTCIPTILKSSTIGVGIGALPGAGAAIAAFISYNGAKNSMKPGEIPFGEGNIKGVAAPESANNAVTAASLIPLLTLGIPGSVNAAALIGALTMHNLNPGPMLFINHAPVVYGFIASLFFINVFMLVQGRLLSGVFSKVMAVPSIILIPILITLCVAGAYSATKSLFNVYVMLGFGIFAYIFTKLKFPPAPLVLGMVLGGLTEFNLRGALITSGKSLSFLFTRPFCLFFVIMGVILVVSLRRRENKDSKLMKKGEK